MDGHLTSKSIKTNKTAFVDNDKYLLELEFNLSGPSPALFLHLEVHKWNKTVLHELRVHLQNILDFAEKYDYELVSFVLEQNESIKFHNLVRLVDFVQNVEGGYKVAGWYTGD